MVKLNEKQIKLLLNAIKNPEERKTVRKFIREIQNHGARQSTDKSERRSTEFFKRKSAKTVLGIISRVALEIGKHGAIEGLFEFFD